MIEYRVYAIGTDDRIAKAIALVCEDDSHAIRQAMEALKNQTIEIWSGQRLVARIDSESGSG
jgi:hypothetical protein